jgi:putative aldouronate transport system permease protein
MNNLNMYFRSKGDKALSGVLTTLLALFLLVELYPLYFVLIASISDPDLVAMNKITLFPRKMTLQGYTMVFKSMGIWLGYMNSLIYTVAGTSLNLLFTLTCAFCMARQPAFKGKGIIVGAFVFTMYFGGGLIPYYLLIRDLGMIDKRLVMVLPGALSVFYMIVVRTFYQSTIPQSLYESARIDGSGDLGMFLRITLPLSTPIIAVMALFFAVGHWNSYFGALIFLPSIEKQPLQLVLRRILILNESLKELAMNIRMTTEELKNLIKRQALAESIKYAVIYIASLPVLIAYPFVQKYFVKGIMIGAIKG